MPRRSYCGKRGVERPLLSPEPGADLLLNQSARASFDIHRTLLKKSRIAASINVETFNIETFNERFLRRDRPMFHLLCRASLLTIFPHATRHLGAASDDRC